MRLLGLYDYECRIVFFKDSVKDDTYDATSILGTHPWDWVLPEKKSYVKAEILRIFDTQVEQHYFGFHFVDPFQPTSKSFLFHNALWVGLTDVAVAVHVWEFPEDLGNLTEREREVLWKLGDGKGVKAVAKDVNLSQHTIHSHIKNVRNKLSLDSIDEVTVFASRYREAVPDRSQNEGQ